PGASSLSSRSRACFRAVDGGSDPSRDLADEIVEAILEATVHTAGCPQCRRTDLWPLACDVLSRKAGPGRRDDAQEGSCGGRSTGDEAAEAAMEGPAPARGDRSGPGERADGGAAGQIGRAHV